MIGWSFNGESFDVDVDDEGNLLGLIVHIDSIDLIIHPLEWEESDKRVATALWISLIHFKDSIRNLLKKHGMKKSGIFNIDIFPFSSFKENFNRFFPYQGVMMNEVEDIIQIEGLNIIFAPDAIWLVVRDNLEEELFLEDNIMLGIIFSKVIFGLLSLLCGLDSDIATDIAIKFSHETIPKEPKIVTHATAMALIGSKKENNKL